MKEILGLGLEPKDLSVVHVCIRGAIVFFAALIIVRSGHKRFLSRMTAFDTVLGFMLASMLSRAINGSAPMLPTLVCGFALVLLHRVLSALTFYSPLLGGLVKGSPDVLVRDGHPDQERLRKHRITESDLLEEARLNGKISEIAQVREAVLERSGKVSIVPKS